MPEERTELLPSAGGPQESPIKRMTWLAFTVSSVNLLTGMSRGFSTLVLPAVKFSISDASWYASIDNFGSIFGIFLSGVIIDRFGRKPALMIGILPAIIGWLFQIIGSTVSILLIGRFLCGLTTGVLFMAPVYISECIAINEPDLRARLLSWNITLFSFGYAIDCILGGILHYTTIAFIAIVLAIIIFGLMFRYIPESPTWLHSRGRIAEAYASEKKLGIPQPVLKTPSIVVRDGKTSSSLTFWKSIFEKVKRNTVRKPLVITSTILTLSCISGGPCILAYLIQILSTWPGDTGSSYLFGMVSGVLMIIANLLVTYLLPYTGMKKHFIFVCGLMSFGFLIMGFTTFDGVTGLTNAIRVLSIWLIVFVISCGVSGIPTTILGEMFPADASGVTAVPGMLSILATGIIIKLHPYFLLYLHNAIYYVYAILGVITIVVTSKYMPETVGRTLEQIGDYYTEI